MRTSSHCPFVFGHFASRAAPLVAVAVLGIFGSPVWAQPRPAGPARPAAAPKQPAATRNYAALPVDADQRNKRLEIQGFLRDGAVPQDRRADFEAFYKTYALARWTDPLLLPELEKKPNYNLPDCRSDLGNDLFLARNGPVHDELAALALEFLAPLAGDATRHPVSRYNAMLAIGDLKQVESRSPSVRPVPWGPAMPVLMQALVDPNQIDAVRVAALIGIYRHAVLQGNDYRIQERDQLRAELLKVAETKEDPRRATEGQVWLRSRAMDVLGALKDPGPQNAVVRALAAIVADRDDDLAARRAAARALGRLSMTSGPGLDSSEMAAALGQLAADASAAELAKIAEEAKQKSRGPVRRMGVGMSGYMGGDEYMPPMYEEYGGAPGYPGGYEESMPMMPPGMGSPYGPYGPKKPEEQPDDTLNNRRRLKAFLNAAFLGLSGIDWTEWADWERNNPAGSLPSSGVAGLVTAQAQRDLVKGLMTGVDGLSKLCDNKDKLDREAFTAELEKQLGDLTQALGAVAAPPAGPPPPGAAPPKTPPEGAGPAAETAPPAAPPDAAAPGGAGEPAGTSPAKAPPAATPPAAAQPPANP